MKEPYITYPKSSTGQLVLPINTELLIKSDDPVFTFNEILGKVNLRKYINESHLGRDGYKKIALLKIILFSFMIKVRSTRSIADLCANDIRFMWLGDNITPSHNTIGRFIKDHLTNNIESIFAEINKFLIEEDSIDTRMLYIDGTKIEAYANRYTFVWKKAALKFQQKLYLKITKCFQNIDKLDNLNRPNLKIVLKDEYEPIDLIEMVEALRSKVIENNISFVYGKGSRKTPIQRCYEEIYTFYEKAKEYIEKIEICGPNRNSYSKTDHDATFMRMKDDYMGNGQLKAGYNVQLGVSDEYILLVDVYQDRSDSTTFISFMDRFKSLYSFMPKYPIGDAGYGNFDNYSYCKENGLELYLKYNYYAKEKTKKFQKQRFHTRNFIYHANETIKCPENHKMTYLYTSYNNQGVYTKELKHYMCEHCHDCEYKDECTKAKDGIRKIQVNWENRAFETEVKENLGSLVGNQFKINRSITVEGAIGVIKENMKYRRFSRRGIINVKTEITLMCIGFNLMKYHNKKKRAKLS